MLNCRQKYRFITELWRHKFWFKWRHRKNDVISKNRLWAVETGRNAVFMCQNNLLHEISSKQAIRWAKTLILWKITIFPINTHSFLYEWRNIDDVIITSNMTEFVWNFVRLLLLWIFKCVQNFSFLTHREVCFPRGGGCTPPPFSGKGLLKDFPVTH